MRLDRLRRRLDALYRHYDHRFVDPDPLQFVRGQRRSEDREVVGLVASALAYGNVRQIKRSIAAVLDVVGPRPARALRRLSPQAAHRALSGFKHRFNDGRDVACLLYFVRQMLETAGSVEAFFAAGLAPGTGHLGPALASFSTRTLALDHGGLYGDRPLPRGAGVRFFFPTPDDGSACKRLNLYLRWMVRREGVDLGLWRTVDPCRLVIPLDAHVFAIARRVGLTRYRSPGWRMALDITERLRRLDPGDPVKYDFALHRMGLWQKEDEIRSLGSRAAAQSTGGPETIATGAPPRNRRRAVSLS
ncbi:MAG TPA: TIGR02757 family protein [Vicinamibacteria bacterium]|nr:TIGR02757 family protein [Vicinamibacteria bacterium]